MNKKYLQLFIVFILLLFFDLSIIYFFELNEFKFKTVFFVNAFLFIITLIFFLLYQWLLKIKTKSPFIYLSISFFKMILSLIFLYPMYSNSLGISTPYILHFFALYFAYLFIEICLLIKDSR